MRPLGPADQPPQTRREAALEAMKLFRYYIVYKMKIRDFLISFNWMGRERYDSQWKEVRIINNYAMLLVYVNSAIRGVGFLVVTWATVVLLGGFVSMVDKLDFWQLALITLIELLWINGSFKERTRLSDVLLILKAVKNVFTRNRKLGGIVCNHHREQPAINQAAADVLVAVRWVLELAHRVVLSFFIASVMCLVMFGLHFTTSISILGLITHKYYGDKAEGRANLDPAHNVLYALCMAQGALSMYRSALVHLKEEKVKQVSQAYSFQDDGHAVSCYLADIRKGYFKKTPSCRERNLITYAVQLMESKSSRSCFFGALILDRLLTRQHSDETLITGEEKQQEQSDLEEMAGAPVVKKDMDNKEERNKTKEAMRKKRQQNQQTEGEIIVEQRRMIRRLIGSASSTHILEKLLHTLDSRRSIDKLMREAAVRIVEHVAGGIRLIQFPRGIQCISSLLNCFEEYCRLQPYQPSSCNNIHILTLDSELESESDSESESESNSESDSDGGINRPLSSKMLHGYKELVLMGLNILWSLAGSEDNCTIISNDKHLVSKIMAAVSYDLVHHAGHSEWSTKVVERSLAVMLRLIATAKRETVADLLQQMSEDKEAITTTKTIVTCEECKGGELQKKAMQILTQLCMEETADRGNLIKMLVTIFVNGDTSDSIRETAVKALVLLFLGRKSVAPLLPKEENDGFICGLTKILVGDNDTCRESAAEILEHLCIYHAENGECVGTLRNAMMGVMPKVLEEILLGCESTGEEGIPEYTRSGGDVESQVITDNDKKKKKKSTSSRPRQKRHHRLHVALLSLCVTACDKLHLDLDAISLGEGRDQARDPEECFTISLATKMVQLNQGLPTIDDLTVMKLTTRMVIAAMKKLKSHGAAGKLAVLESLMGSLSSVSETMLDLESIMVFSSRMRQTMPATVETLGFLIKQARQLHGEIKDQGSEIVAAS